MTTDTTRRRNGSAKSLPGRLSWAAHAELAARLQRVAQEVTRLEAELAAAYGRNSEVRKRAGRLVGGVDGLRGVLSRAAHHEHPDGPGAELYFPAAGGA